MPFAPTAWLSGVSPFAIPVTVESTITEDPGQPALVEDVSENPNLVALRFYVPAGAPGATGAPGAPGAPGAAATISIGTVSALPYGSAPTVTNTGTSSAAVLDWQLVTGPQGPAGSSSSVFEFQFQTATTAPPTAGHIRLDNVDPALSNSMYVSHIDGNGIDVDYILQLVPPSATLVLQKKGDSTISYTYSVIVTLALTGYVQYETLFVSSSGTLANNDQVILVVVNNAPPGEAATVNVGTVTQVPYSPTAITVTNSGTTSAALLDFTLCAGPAATIAVGTVTTGAPGSSAVVTNVGTSSAAVFDMTIPQGPIGPAGPSNTFTTTSFFGYYSTNASTTHVNMPSGTINTLGSIASGVTTATTNIRTMQMRGKNAPSSTGDGQDAGWLGTISSNTTTFGRCFYYSYSFGIEDTVSGSTRSMIGLFQNTTPPTLSSTATVQASTIPFCGIIQEVGENVWSFYTRGSSGFVKTATDVSCSAPSSLWYQLTIDNAPGSANCTMTLTAFSLNADPVVRTNTFVPGAAETPGTSLFNYVLLIRSMASAGGLNNTAQLSLAGVKIHTL